MTPERKAAMPNIKIYPDSFEALVRREELSGLAGLQIRPRLWMILLYLSVKEMFCYENMEGCQAGF